LRVSYWKESAELYHQCQGKTIFTLAVAPRRVILFEPTPSVGTFKQET